MASFDMRKRDSEMGTDTGVATDENAKPAEPAGRPAERAPRRPGHRVVGAVERDRMLKEARNIEFPIGLRGYERAAVDRYVERVNRMIAELEMSASPESAVRHALEEVSEETRDILQHAHQAADDITARSRAKADDRLQEAEQEAEQALSAARESAAETRKGAEHAAQEVREAAQHEVAELRETAMREIAELREAAVRESQQLRSDAQREADKLLGSARREAGEMLERAETRERELAGSAEAIWRERRRLIDDMRAVGEQLVAIGEVEGKRFAHLAEDLSLGGAELRREAPDVSTAEPQETASG